MDVIIDGGIEPGTVLVIRYEGPKGGPGMREMLAITGALTGAGRGSDCDARHRWSFSGGTRRGSHVGHVAPETVSGGPIALVNDGDRIVIDAVNGSIDLMVDAAELERRLEAQLVLLPPRLHQGRAGQVRAARCQQRSGERSARPEQGRREACDTQVPDSLLLDPSKDVARRIVSDDRRLYHTLVASRPKGFVSRPRILLDSQLLTRAVSGDLDSILEHLLGPSSFGAMSPWPEFKISASYEYSATLGGGGDEILSPYRRFLCCCTELGAFVIVGSAQATTHPRLRHHITRHRARRHLPGRRSRSWRWSGHRFRLSAMRMPASWPRSPTSMHMVVSMGTR